MRRIGANLLIICFYCFPFVYFSMYKDFENGSMIGYLMMIIITSLLAFFGKLSNHMKPIIIGNIVSACISFYFISIVTSNERWDFYFKPLTPIQLLILVSFLNLIPQFIAVKLAFVVKRKV